ncbi:FAD-binding domain-containing protein [Rubrimonas cliftonensis]|uniref:Deoxyribodipyrimidine photo-lyase n=1 Tax=Rubrimonas cliftonensis TaxID=89524 RepID=A0A1H3X0M0_9RHOB|nr:FAD-binding domain-containing protein [Rubrimonas cliftonensis]SDZ92927.1 deoxyribodipyrimidine photo-lyase [Rubrimonas cliftonensis]
MNQFSLDLPGVAGDDAATADQRRWPPTRAEGLARLEAFRGRMGRHYARNRNFDWGPDRRDNVSLVSPWLRRRLVTEEEAVRMAVETHGGGADKFVQEVFWRSYWKGWLEMRPSVWRAYVAGRDADRMALRDYPDLAARLAKAEAGETGLECFDAWARELVDTGWLHNHARMWFASIWVFTLELPWRLGADFFLRNLLDGDPASNTLGWRWVAGLHTRGKVYSAEAWNIAKFTSGRFQPDPRDLAPDPAPLHEEPTAPAAPLAPAPRLDPDRPAALLLTEEDLAPEDWRAAHGLDFRGLRAAATLQLSQARSDQPISPAVARFDCGALEDAGERARALGAPLAERLADVAPADLARWARRAGAVQVVTGWAPVGPVRDQLAAARPALREVGAELVMLRRPWDDAVWPHATAGFFKVKEKIPGLVKRLIHGAA